MGDIKGLKYEWISLWKPFCLEECGNLGIVTLVGCDSGGGVELGYCLKKGTQLALELQVGLNARNVNTSWCLQAC